jgi:hypothetical protein
MGLEIQDELGTNLLTLAATLCTANVALPMSMNDML